MLAGTPGPRAKAREGARRRAEARVTRDNLAGLLEPRSFPRKGRWGAWTRRPRLACENQP